MYDIRDNKPYTVRKLADGNCWMTDNLELELSTGTPVLASMNDGSGTFSWTPTNCSMNGACAMNGNTTFDSSANTHFYSWYAAVAGTNASSGDINTSICPAGWRLPANYTIDSRKSFGSLTNAYGFTVNGANNTSDNTTRFASSPLNLLRYGSYYNGIIYDYNSYGYSWASTVSNSAEAYGLSIYTARTFPQFDTQKYYGLNIRCVAL